MMISLNLDMPDMVLSALLLLLHRIIQSSAYLTNLCHASIVSRELGIPCIVGTKSRGEAATTTIPDGIDVTIDATHGVVYEGIIEEPKAEQPAQQVVAAAEYFPPTGTKIYMNLGDPELAEKYSTLPCDGIGLPRSGPTGPSA